MATINKTFNGGDTTFTASITGTNVTVSGSSFSVATPTCTSKYNSSGHSYNYYSAEITGDIMVGSLNKGSRTYTRDAGSASNNTVYSMTRSSSSSVSVNTGDVFTSSNATSGTVSVSFKSTSGYFDVVVMSGGHPGAEDWYDIPSGQTWSGIATITLNVPPTADVGQLTADTSQFLAGVTTISVPVSNMVAAYGGNFTDGSGGATITVGSQTSDAIHADGSITLRLSSAGTFTPVVTVTDSRGQTYTETLPAITVLPYSLSTEILVAERTRDTGAAYNEGINAAIAARFTYPDAPGNYLLEPTVTIDGERYFRTSDTTVDSGTTYYSRSGSGTIADPYVYTEVEPVGTEDPSDEGWFTEVAVTWYTEWDRLSGFDPQDEVSWTSFHPSSPATLYCFFPQEFDIDSTYRIGIVCNTTLMSGGSASKVLPQGFYLLSARAGGHGLGIGMKPLTDDLHINMDTYFYGSVNMKNHSNEWGTVFDLIYPVGSVYVTNENVNPKSKFGGEWTLINKEFAYSWVSSGFTFNSTNTQSGAFAAILKGHTIELRLTWQNKVAISDNTVTIGTLNSSAIGLDSSGVHTTYNTGFNDYLGGIGMFCLSWSSGTGTLVVWDWATRSTSYPTTTGQGCNMSFTFLAQSHENMLDSFCDKFYWKRTSLTSE